MDKPIKKLGGKTQLKTSLGLSTHGWIKRLPLLVYELQKNGPIFILKSKNCIFKNNFIVKSDLSTGAGIDIFTLHANSIFE